MPTNVTYRGPADIAETIPVFPLPGALLLPRGHLPLNIFEPRYLAMVDDALSSNRLIGMIQPDETKMATTVPALYQVGCVGRITQFEETGDGRYLITLFGVARFRVREALMVMTPYLQCRIDCTEFAADFAPPSGDQGVDREALLHTLAQYLEANRIRADWTGIREAPIETLVNGLSMMSPYGSREKQALLEAADLKTRAELLVAVTEIALAEAGGDGEKSMQ